MTKQRQEISNLHHDRDDLREKLHETETSFLKAKRQLEEMKKRLNAGMPLPPVGIASPTEALKLQLHLKVLQKKVQIYEQEHGKLVVELDEERQRGEDDDDSDILSDPSVASKP